MKRKLFFALMVCSMFVVPAYAKNGADDSGRRDDKRQEDSGKHSGGSSCKRPRVSNLRFSLEPTALFENADIDARLATRTRTCKGGTTVLERLTGRVHAPIPTAELGITDSLTASAQDIHYVFSRAGVDYADCSFRFDADDDDDSVDDSPSAEYRFEMEQKFQGAKSKVRRKKGRCDVDLTQTGIQSGMPALQTGDSIRGEAVIGGARVPFATDVYQ